MNLLLALVLALTPPADAGSKRKEARARLDAAPAFFAVLEAVQQGRYDEPGLEEKLQGAIDAAPDRKKHLLMAQLRVLRTDRDLDGADAAIRAAMAQPGFVHITEANDIVQTATMLAQRRVLDAEKDPDTYAVATPIIDSAMALLDVAEAFGSAHEVAPGLVAIARVQVLQLGGAPPERIEPAVAAGRVAEPGNVGLMVLHADLLTRKGDAEGAVELLKQALAAEPDHLAANYNMGAYYINRAAAVQKESLDTLDLDVAAALSAQASALQAQARPYFETVHRLDPSDTEILRQLIAVAVMQEDMEAYQAYKAKLDALQGQ